jgi:hypothetical protein
MKKLLTIFFLLNCSIVRSECTNQVTHLTGTVQVNGVNVTVTSSGLVDTFYTYCPNTFPYFIGASWQGITGTGSYSFIFSPPVSALTLNFSGITNNVTCCQEVIKLFVNGNHYAIPSTGVFNDCDSMAQLTSEGDITGCSNCNLSGWNGTTISGVISSLTVLDTMVLGASTGGSLFSLFICNSHTTEVIGPAEVTKINFYPNPFSTQLTFAISGNEEATIIIYDIFSRLILQKTLINSTTINTEEFEEGIYFYELKNSKGVIKAGKIIRH